MKQKTNFQLKKETNYIHRVTQSVVGLSTMDAPIRFDLIPIQSRLTKAGSAVSGKELIYGPICSPVMFAVALVGMLLIFY